MSLNSIMEFKNFQVLMLSPLEMFLTDKLHTTITNIRITRRS